MLRILLKIENRVNPGLLLIGAGILALIWANLPNFNLAYFHVAEFEIPLSRLGLAYLPDLTVEEFVRDFLLAIFFFGIGLELKQEFTVGTLRSPKLAILPIISAAGGMLAPSFVYLVITLWSGNADLISGFAIPTATDIAFSVGILALIGKNIHPAVRIFLLTLAVTDDILGIIVIAIGYSSHLNWVFLLLCLLTLVIFFGVVRIYHPIAYVLGPILGVIVWYFMFASGVHPAISGVALGLCMSSKVSRGRTQSRAQKMLVGLSPVSDLLVLPIFAFFQLGVPLGAVTFDSEHLSLLIACALGLVVGKPLGIMLFTVLVSKFPSVGLPKGLGYRNYLGVSCLAGTGFTVSFLICTLAFEDPTLVMSSKLGVLIGSFTAALLAVIAAKVVEKFPYPDSGSTRPATQSN